MTDIAKYVTSEGVEFFPFENNFPILKYFYTDFEHNFDGTQGRDFFERYSATPIVLSILYVIVIFGGREVMKSRKAFDLKKPLAMWNLFLSLFSFIGMLRIVPVLVHSLMTISYEDTVCRDPNPYYVNGASGLWIAFFCFSKTFELIDTMFIVLRKKPLLFLHWYHHITVLLYCWYSLIQRPATCVYFVAMNYTVHSIMYGYYFLMAMGKKSPIPDWSITAIQIAQMIVGTIVVVSSAYYKIIAERSCSVENNNLIAGLLMYGSYFALFFHFALQRFVFPKKKKTVKKDN